MADLSLDDLAIFVRVVEDGSFASAARTLRTPTSTVSRAITRLETTAGVRLLHRTTRNVTPTSEGRELYATTSSAVTSLRQATRSLEPVSRKPKGRLRVSAPGDLAAAFLSDVIVGFAARYPLVQLDFALTNQRSNLVSEGFDVGLRATAHPEDSSLVARKLGVVEHHLYASPTYLAERGAPRTPADLQWHRCVVFRGKELVRTWRLESAAGETSVDVRGTIGGDDFTFVRSIVRSGGGIGALPRLNCVVDEAEGRLVRVLPEHHLRGASLYIVYPSAKNVPARVTAFRDYVLEAYKAWESRP